MFSVSFQLASQIDGYLARRYKMSSVLGTILDPAADKILMTTLTVTLAIQNLLPSALLSASLVTFDADCATPHSSCGCNNHWPGCPTQPLGVLHPFHLSTTSSVFYTLHTPPIRNTFFQKTFKRYWDFSIPSAEVHPTAISKVRFCTLPLFLEYQSLY
jgi:cardiolipin synthase